MTTQLATEVDGTSFSNPADYERFFTTKDRQVCEGKFTRPRETPPIGVPGKSCESNLFLGFFHDGTRNNYALSEKNGDHTHSNVARLFDAYPGQTICPALLLSNAPDVKWPDEGAYPNYFRVYIPGVGTPFDEVKDSGEGVDGTLGAATARWGERRLIWALAQAINAVHRYFLKAPLLSNNEILDLSRRVELDRYHLKAKPVFIGMDQAPNTMAMFQQVLLRLHGALSIHMHAPGAQPAKVDPGVLQNIYVSAFGFSRGAAAARVFSRWLVALCKLDAQLLGRTDLSLAGFPVTFDFLGLFDTVASVGLASSSLIADGHGGWADAEVSLRHDPEVKRCLHLVAAHEVRRSFPLDSISVNGVLDAGCEEMVFPGVHSDVGGGYMPKEQGRGQDALGADMLSRVPLAVMYREARLAGAPLKLERCRSFVKDRFKIAPETIEAFNAFLAASAAYAKAHPRASEKPLRMIMRGQMELSILWRKAWAGRMSQMPSVRRAAQVDFNDIVSADQEFVQEIKAFEAWRESKFTTGPICADGVLGTCMSIEERNIPGLDSGRFDEWEDIERFWSKGNIDPAIAALFENYVHDSRAWFKLSGLEAGEVEASLKRWVVQYDDYKAQLSSPMAYSQMPVTSPLTTEQEGWVKQYKATGKVPPMKTKGREPFELGAGYLRFRRVYAGGDSIRLTRTAVPGKSAGVAAVEREQPAQQDA